MKIKNKHDFEQALVEILYRFLDRTYSKRTAINKIIELIESE